MWVLDKLNAGQFDIKSCSTRVKRQLVTLVRDQLKVRASFHSGSLNLTVQKFVEGNRFRRLKEGLIFSQISKWELKGVCQLKSLMHRGVQIEVVKLVYSPQVASQWVWHISTSVALPHGALLIKYMVFCVLFPKFCFFCSVS